MPTDSPDLDSEISPPVGQLRWRCRRGTQELDRILGGFLEEDYARLSADLQRNFSDLLAQQDPVINDWLMGAERAEASFLEIITLIRHKYKLQ